MTRFSSTIVSPGIVTPFIPDEMTSMLTGEEASRWLGLIRLSQQAPCFVSIMDNIARNGMTYVDDRIVSWGFQAGVFVVNPGAERPTLSAFGDMFVRYMRKVG